MKLTVLFGMVSLFPALASAYNIGFDTMAGVTGEILTSHSEGGFTVSPIKGGIWAKSFSNGQPAPALFFNPPHQFVYDNWLKIVRTDGGLFTFQSVDLYSSLGALKEIMGGTYGNLTVYEGGWAFTGFNTYLNSHPDAQIDRLFVRVYTNGDAMSGGLDNIRVTAVPEPSTLLALTGGTALLALRRRRFLSLDDKPSRTGLGGDCE